MISVLQANIERASEWIWPSDRSIGGAKGATRMALVELAVLYAFALPVLLVYVLYRWAVVYPPVSIPLVAVLVVLWVRWAVRP